MAERLHPGVYVEEVSSGVRPIEGVSTSTAAFIGEAARGVPGTAHFLTSFDDFTSALGGHVPGDKGLLAQAVEAFFANGGRRAYAVRVLPSNAVKGSSSQQATRYTPPGTLSAALFPKALSFEAKGEGVWADALRIEIDAATHSPSSAFRVKVGWSENGVTRLVETHDDVRMDSSSDDYVVDVLKRNSRYIAAIDLFALTTSSTTPTTLPIFEEGPVITTAAVDGTGHLYVQKDSELLLQWWTGDTPSGAPTKLVITQAAVTAATSPAETFDAKGEAKLTPAELATLLNTAFGTEFTATAVPTVTPTKVEIRPKVYVSPYLVIPDPSVLQGKVALLQWNGGGSASVTVPAAATNAAITSQIDAMLSDALFSVRTRGNAIVIRGISPTITTISINEDTVPANVFGSVKIDGRAGTVVDSLNAVTAAITENRIPGVPSTLQKLGLAGGVRARGYAEDSSANPGVRPAATTTALRLTGGSDGSGGVGLAQYTGNQNARTGLHAFDLVEVNLVAIPGKNTPEFIAAGGAYCDGRGDCFFLADGPGQAQGALDITAADARAFVESLPHRSKNAAIYFPWIRISDPLGVGRNPTRYAPPSGFMAGIYARTDNTRGVWKAPAGLEATVSGALGVQMELLDADQDLLNPASLNCMRQFPAAGVVTWGARTLSSDPEWRYVPVRRMALFLKESLRRGMQWAVFEPNDQELWDQIRANITSFMLGLFRQGAFQGASPDEAFRVKCDRSTNPQEKVDAGIVTAQVAFAPIKPAEFVVIEISQKSLVG